MKKLFTEAQTRAWLEVRIEGFTPRIKRTNKTKAMPYTFTLEELSADLGRTLVEFQNRIAEGKN